MKHLFSRFRKDIIGVAWLSMGTFTGLALISYNPSDPSFNFTGGGASIQNYCGYFGSVTADILYQLAGLGSWAFVVSVASLGINLIRNPLETRYISGLWSFLLVFIPFCLGALYWPEALFFDGQISVGGVAGGVVINHLKVPLNPIGTSVLLWTLWLLAMIFLTKKTVMEVFYWPWILLRWLLRQLGLNWLFQWILDSFQKVKRVLRSTLALPGKVLVGPTMALEPKPSVKVGFSLDSQFPVEPSVHFRLKGENERGKFLNDFFPINRDKSLGDQKVRDRFVGLLEKDQRMTEQRCRVNLKKRVERCIAHWELPNLSLLKNPPLTLQKVDEKEVRRKADLLLNKLEQFSVRGKITEIRPGPAVTMFEFRPNVDVKISRITDLADDLSLALSSESVRIIAPIPGRDVVGIETSNHIREIVYLKDILANDEFWADEMKLPIALGRQADGKVKIVDLRKMPHLLVAGSTGSGKSVFTVSMLSGLLFRHSPKTLRMVLVDPKQVDLAAFDGIPHLLMPPIRESKKAISALKWAMREMDRRYRSMSKFGARGLELFNEKTEMLTREQIIEHEERNDSHSGQTYYYTPQPYIIVVVEEFGDLMAVDKGNVEQAVVRLAQMARACGIHLVLAMQSPRKDVVTGLIKTNIPGRISFKVASKTDSRIILDESGAERLLTRGDMLFSSPGLSKPLRHHGPWLSDLEIDGLTNYWREQGEPEFDEYAMRALNGSGGGLDLDDIEEEPDEGECDEKYDEILAEVARLKEVSASLLQRKFRLGYPRAARMIELFEKEGVIGPAQGSKPRLVLINKL